MNRRIAVAIACLWIMAANVYADGTHPQGIKLDGTIGTAGKIDLPGPDYAIKPEYGKQSGTNLFHSFQQFSINTGESATFAGPDSVKNIISRVTGGSASWIDGKLASTIPGADLYFLNPAGVMFGSNALLDLQGSFHVSTADYLRMGESERFYSTPMSDEVLSVAAPIDFGFLNDTPAKILSDHANLEVSEGKDISFIGGDIELRNTTLLAPKGRIAIEGQGNVDMSDSLIKQEGGGSVVIRSRQFSGDNVQFFVNATDDKDSSSIDIDAKNISLKNSTLYTTPMGTGNGGDVILNAEESVLCSATIIFSYNESYAKDAGNVRISADNISVTEKSNINTSTRSKGIGGDISFNAETSFLCSDSLMYASTQSQEQTAGNAGKIQIEAENISVRNSEINTNTYGIGNGGNIVFSAKESVMLSNAKITSLATGNSENSGNSGNISLKAGDIALKDGSYLSTSTYSKGKGGDVNITASGMIGITGAGSGIFTNADSPDDSAGIGGNIAIYAGILSLSDKGTINASNRRGGRAGNIMLHVGSLYMDNESSITSESPFPNAYTDFATITERDDNTLIAGDKIVVRNDNGKSSNLIYTGKSTLLFKTYYVRNISELNALADKNIVMTGDIAEVSDAGDGNPGRFINNGTSPSGWVRFYENKIFDIADTSELNKLNYQFYADIRKVPYAAGDMIRVRDMGDGKAGLFVYTLNTADWGAFSTIIRVSHFTVGNMTEFNRLIETTSVSDADTVSVKDKSESTFVFDKNDWVKVTDNIHSFENWTEEGGLISVMTGNIATVKDRGDGKSEVFAYSGKEWVTLNRVYSVAKLSECSDLSVQTGDIVYIADDGSGKSANFLYDNGQWIKFSKNDAGTIDINADSIVMKNKSRISSSTYGNGDASDIVLRVKHLEADSGSFISSESNSQYFGGDSGKITINTDDSVKLLGNSFLTTDAADAGGGKISIHAGNSIYLHNSDISSSVHQGIGKGGDIEASSKFVILNQGNITANAQEGDGGAVFIQTENFLKSFGSIVEASSARGNQGTVKIEAPDSDISSGLTILPVSFFDASRWAATPCEARSGETESRFEVRTHIRVVAE